MATNVCNACKIRVAILAIVLVWLPVAAPVAQNQAKRINQN